MPIGKARPRVTTRWGFAHAYTPKKTKNAEKEYRHLIALQLPKGFKPFVGALKVDMAFGMPIPSSVSNKRRLAMIGKAHVKKPDFTNIFKSVEDSANGLLWNDDSQICEVSGLKAYSNKPFISISVTELEIDTSYILDNVL